MWINLMYTWRKKKLWSYGKIIILVCLHIPVPSIIWQHLNNHLIMVLSRILNWGWGWAWVLQAEPIICLGICATRQYPLWEWFQSFLSFGIPIAVISQTQPWLISFSCLSENDPCIFIGASYNTPPKHYRSITSTVIELTVQRKPS